MSQREPGLDLHEWETRWAELEEAFSDDPAGALPEACDVVEELVGRDGLDEGLRLALDSARETADAIERGDQVDPGDLGGAIENLRAVRTGIGPRFSE